MRIITLIGGFLFITIIFGMFMAYGQQEEKAQVSSGLAVMAKLEEITGNQQTILQKLDKLKADIEIIKVRTARR